MSATPIPEILRASFPNALLAIDRESLLAGHKTPALLKDEIEFPDRPRGILLVVALVYGSGPSSSRDP